MEILGMKTKRLTRRWVVCLKFDDCDCNYVSSYNEYDDQVFQQIILPALVALKYKYGEYEGVLNAGYNCELRVLDIPELPHGSPHSFKDMDIKYIDDSGVCYRCDIDSLSEEEVGILLKKAEEDDNNYGSEAFLTFDRLEENGEIRIYGKIER